MLWFDLDNSPHVPLFRPILSELSERRQPFYVTARDFAQTRQLIELWRIPHTLVGKHGGKGRIRKLANLFHRSMQLRNLTSRLDLRLAVSHGSRTQLVAAKTMGIPSILMLDYEYTEAQIFNALATWLLMPALIPDKRLADAGFRMDKVIRYPGFKEEIYLANFVPQAWFRDTINIGPDAVLVVVRPPGTTGNYDNPRSEKLFTAVMDHLSSLSQCHCLVVNRAHAKDRQLEPYIDRPNISVLSHAVDGLQLLWNADVVISGGGTMNREAALLGVPTYSIFAGRHPFLDEYLREQGKLTFLGTLEEIRGLNPVKRQIPSQYTPQNPNLASTIVDLLLDIMKMRPLGNRSPPRESD